MLKELWKKLDKVVLLIPITVVLVLATLMTIFPQAATTVIDGTSNFLKYDFGVYYLIFGLLSFGILIFLSFSKIGNIKLGKPEDKPMKPFQWGMIVFTSTLAADILFYALHEWTYYWNSDISDIAQTTTNGQKVLWSSTYSLFHWTGIPWSFYLVLAICYGFMLYVRHRRDRQKLSEACRPLFGRHVEKAPGKAIDIISIICLLFGTSTTFSVATPLMTHIACKVFNLPYNLITTVIILILIAIVYTLAVLKGTKGIAFVAKLATILMGLALAIFFFVGGPKFIIESGVQGVGNLFSNFISMATWTDPVRASSFPQDWTVYYTSYWIAWCVGNPFFIAKISKGMKIKHVALGGIAAGFLGTFMSFTILGGYGMNAQINGTFDAAGLIAAGGTPYTMIIDLIFASQPQWLAYTMIITLFFAMLGLYSSTFDALTDVVSCFSYKRLDVDEAPHKAVKILWAFVFLALPIGLTFLDGTTTLLMAMSIIGALPMTIIMIFIVISFFKDIKSYTKEITINQSVSE